MKKIVSLITALAVIFSVVILGTVNASAATSSLKFSASSVEVGSKVTVTVVLQNNSPMISAQCIISYNESVLRYDSGSAAGGAGVLTYIPNEYDLNKYTATLNFTAIAVGQSQIQVKDCKYTYSGSDGFANEEAFGGQTATVTVKDKALSNNANLKSLSLNVGTLSPKFSQSRTSYTAKVTNDVTKVNVTANVADGAAKVISVEGNSNLKEGENNVVVTVQAADGTQKKYTIVVTRLKLGEKTDEQIQQEAEEEQRRKLEATVNDTTYSVATDISAVPMFTGFTVSSAEYNGIEVPVATDEKGIYTLYYLKSAESDLLTPYTYDKENGTFKILSYLSLGDNLYIFETFPSEYKANDGLYPSNQTFGDFSVECFLSNDEKLSDFCYVYCYSGGEYSVYRYDKKEGTMQRYPEFSKTTEVLENTENKESFFARFKSLSTNSKVILVCLAVAVLGAIALIVLLIIFLVKKFGKNNAEIIFDDYTDDFDVVEETKEETAEETEETQE